jgi:prepilin-type processing-associated H-X9-DG protein
MEQDAVYKLLTNGVHTPNSTLTPPLAFKMARLPYNQCPSDGYLQEGGAMSADGLDDVPRGSYFACTGPQYIFPDGCGGAFTPFVAYYSGTTDYQPTDMYTNGYVDNIANIRGMFGPSGVQTAIRDTLDGLSNTIAIGEALPKFALRRRNNDNGPWYAPMYGLSSTVIPINYQTFQQTPACSVDPLRESKHDAVAFGFKSLHPGGANFLMGDGSVRFLRETIQMQTYQLLGCRHDGKALPNE